MGQRNIWSSQAKGKGQRAEVSELFKPRLSYLQAQRPLGKLPALSWTQFAHLSNGHNSPSFIRLF